MCRQKREKSTPPSRFSGLVGIKAKCAKSVCAPPPPKKKKKQVPYAYVENNHVQIQGREGKELLDDSTS